MGNYWWTASGFTPLPNNCLGASGFRCYTATNIATSVVKTTPSCDPTVGSCGVQIHLTATIPGLRSMVLEDGLGGIPTPFLDWYPCSGAGCTADMTCGVPGSGGQVNFDNVDTWLARNLSCAQAFATNLSVRIRVCPAGCPKPTIVELPAIDLAQKLGCPTPPPDDCDDPEQCRACKAVAGGGGAPPPCSAPIGSKGISCGKGDTGPGAFLRYRAGGVGAYASFPGTTDWNIALGRGWSHDYSERIVSNDPAAPLLETRIAKVWLLTRAGSFRQFSSLAAGSGLRLYQSNAPSDEYRRLYYNSTSLGWELLELNGTRHFFDSAGRWTQTIEPGNPTHPRIATYTGAQLTSVTLPDGRSETFTYNGAGKLATIVENPVAGSAEPARTWTYSWTGDDLTLILRPDNTALEYTYGDPTLPGFLTRIRLIGSDLTSGRVLAGFEYNDFGYLEKSWRGDPIWNGPDAVDLQVFTYTGDQLPTQVQVTDALGVLTTYSIQRDPKSVKPRMTSINGECTTCGLAPNTTFEYTHAAHPLRESATVNARGFRTEYTYTAFGRPLTRTEAVGQPEQRLTTWSYDSVYPGLVTQIEQPSTSTTPGQFRRTQMVYNATTALMSPRTVTGREAEVPFSFSTEFTYNGSGRPLTTDRPGYGTADVTTLTYNVPGRLDFLPDSLTEPFVGTTSYGYDGYNRRTTVTDPNGVQVVTTHDPGNRVIEQRRKGAVAGDDLVTTHEYNVFKDLVRVTLPRGNVIEYGYDSAGRMIRMDRKPDAATPAERTAYTLDKLGNRTLEDLQRWDGVAFVSESKTEYVYSSRCHLDKVIRGKDSANASTTEQCYDKNNNLDKVWDANHPSAGQTAPPSQSYVYDSLDRLITSTQPYGGAGGGNASTGYLYDVQDHLRQVTDAEGNVTTYTTGDRDLMTQQVSPVSGTTAYAYNEHGALTATTDARGIIVTRTVDAIDRTTRVDYPDPRLDTDFVFDGGPVGSFFKGRLRSITSNGEMIAYDYDRFGRLLQDGTLFYQHDKNGNRTRTTYPSGLQTDFTYDFADRQASLTAVGGGLASTPIVTGATYKPSGPLTTLSFGNGLTEQRLLDQRYFPGRITVPTRIDWVYTVDALGNTTQIADGGVPRVYGYQDFQYFVTQGDGPWGTRSWTYDKIGNRLTETRTGGLTDTYSYVTNGSGGRNPKLQSIALASSAGSRIFRYNQIGDELLTSDPQRERLRSYDDAGRLMRIIESTTRASSQMRYDGRGFLAEVRQDTTACSPVGERPTYSSEGRLMERRQYSLFDPATATAQDAVLYFAGRPVATARTAPGSAAVTFLTTDHLGTPILATNSTTTTLWVGGLEPFGADWSGAQSAGMFLRFPGQWSDSAWSASEDLVYNVHRWYAPGAGRYNQGDRYLPVSGRDPNPYIYSRNQPILLTDPKGLFVIDDSCDCTPPWSPAENIPRAMGQAGNFPNGPRCQAILQAHGVWPCVPNRFKPDEIGAGPLIKCQPNPPGTDDCGETTPPYLGYPLTIHLYPGRPACPRNSPGPGISATLFHETLHSCALQQGSPLTESDAVAITSVCTGFN